MLPYATAATWPLRCPSSSAACASSRGFVQIIPLIQHVRQRPTHGGQGGRMQCAHLLGLGDDAAAESGGFLQLSALEEQERQVGNAQHGRHRVAGRPAQRQRFLVGGNGLDRAPGIVAGRGQAEACGALDIGVVGRGHCDRLPRHGAGALRLPAQRDHARAQAQDLRPQGRLVAGVHDRTAAHSWRACCRLRASAKPCLGIAQVAVNLVQLAVQEQRPGKGDIGLGARRLPLGRQPVQPAGHRLGIACSTSGRHGFRAGRRHGSPHNRPPPVHGRWLRWARRGAHTRPTARRCRLGIRSPCVRCSWPCSRSRKRW